MTQYWRDDLVAFLLGCSFTFEWALAVSRSGHRRISSRASTCRCTSPTAGASRAGRVRGSAGGVDETVRPGRRARAAAISPRFPAMHGGPVHVGDPKALGITALDRPDFGDPVRIGPGEVPVFWACGVTPQAVIQRASLPLAIFHAPGHMFITDRPHADFDVDLEAAP